MYVWSQKVCLLPEMRKEDFFLWTIFVKHKWQRMQNKTIFNEIHWKKINFGTFNNDGCKYLYKKLVRVCIEVYLNF